MTDLAPFRLAWATDPHLPHAGPAAVRRFRSEVETAASDARAIALCGDLAQAHDVTRRLEQLLDWTRGRPVWAVLGNHDFYHGSVEHVRRQVTALSARRGDFTYLSAHGPVRPTDRVAVVGHDGWGDARLGRPETTPVQLNDFRLIDELRGLAPLVRNARLRAFGDEAAEALAGQLDELEGEAGLQHVVVVTHVPPFAGATWHEGASSDDNFLPFFGCAATGEVLEAWADAHRSVEVTVLCGHTHGQGVYRHAPNLVVRTGGATYGKPSVQPTLAVGGEGG